MRLPGKGWIRLDLIYESPIEKWKRYVREAEQFNGKIESDSKDREKLHKDKSEIAEPQFKVV